MNGLSALSVSIGLIAGLATFLAVGPLAGLFFIWAATISWAAYFALGADMTAAKNIVVCSIFGTVVATFAAYEIATISPDNMLGFPIMAALIVTITVIAMCLAANIPALATIPATVLGYSATFAYLLQTPGKLSTDVLLGASWDNPIFVISFSLAFGVGLGIASAKFAAKITTIAE
ncbi:MAG: DUF1097 domain-containing protein [Methyloprofundus sp.]|nr:DUF1097 domain-containing protein [Methyloprofundus sp.]